MQTYRDSVPQVRPVAQAPGAGIARKEAPQLLHPSQFSTFKPLIRLNSPTLAVTKIVPKV